LNARNKFFIILAVIFAIALGYYLFSTPRGSDLDLIGVVDANQVIVSPQVAGRISKLLVDEGTAVKQGDLIAVLDPSELEAQARAAAAMIDSLRSQVSATEATSVATQGSTTSSVANAQARLESARAQLVEAEATLQRVESDSRRIRGKSEGAAGSCYILATAGHGRAGGSKFGDREHASSTRGAEHRYFHACPACER